MPGSMPKHKHDVFRDLRPLRLTAHGPKCGVVAARLDPTPISKCEHLLAFAG